MKPSIPKGTRDFLPEQVAKRDYIFNTIEGVFKLYGYVPIETPSFENIETLTGKYGDEGDKLIFKILNSGDYLSDVNRNELEEMSAEQLAGSIAGKALRYDLTVPFARYVVQHQNDLTFPFKRYQIQPVWRADRPQKGRYREFHQCDVDVIGSKSLLNEVELIQIIDQVLSSLGIINFEILVNHRKVLLGLAESLSIDSKFSDMVTALDKWDKIGPDGVVKALHAAGFSSNKVDAIIKFIDTASLEGRSDLLDNQTWSEGWKELNQIQQDLKLLNVKSCKFMPSLARGLSYYTGTIIEVVAYGFNGSICAGGRYDNLTEIFGMKDVSGVGVSFGADRIYDLMEEKNLFPSDITSTVDVMFANFGTIEAGYCLEHFLPKIREAGISAEVYPDEGNIKKQMKYASAKQIKYVVLIGSDEINGGRCNVKNMMTREEESVAMVDLINKLKEA